MVFLTWEQWIPPGKTRRDQLHMDFRKTLENHRERAESLPEMPHSGP